MSAFDAAWSVLKALPEQQIGVAGRTPEQTRNFAEVLAMQSGTMHPAIQGLLARRRANEAPSFRYVGHPLFDPNMRDESVPSHHRMLSPEDPRSQKVRGSAVDRSSQSDLNSRMAINDAYGRYANYPFDLGGPVTNDPRVFETDDRSLGRRAIYLS